MLCPQCGNACAPDTAFCSKCGASLTPASGIAPVAGSHAASIAMPSVVYAGFWRRYVALLVDQFALTIPLLIVVVAVGFSLGLFDSREPAGVLALQGMFYLAYYIAALFYYSLQESSVHQATLGKRALGIKVTDLHGARLTFPKAAARWVAASLSYLTLYVGFIMAAFTRRKQALHDMVASTLVVDRWAFTDQPERQRTGLSGCLIAFVVVVVVGIPVLGILAAIAIPAYQDYSVRAQVAEALNSSASAKSAVAERFTENQHCPANGEDGIGSPESYAGPHVLSITTGHLENGRCAIEVTLRTQARAELDGKTILLELDDDGTHWTCSSEIPDRYLPASCRG